MNQPASKEPTMDEILSSIRQIIADDDEAAAQHVTAAKPANTPASAPSPVAAVPDPEPRRPEEDAPTPQAAPHSQDEQAALRPQDAIDPFSDDEEDDLSPLALSPEQIVEDGESESETSETDTDETLSHAPEPAAADAREQGQDHTPNPADLVMPDDVAFEAEENDDVEAEFGMEAHRDYAEPDPEPGPSYSDAAPMPDSDLSRDLAEELLEPTTKAAVRDAFSRLNTPRLQPETPIGAEGLTIESMLREMLRPMLKDWLDENLPAMVERLVEQEIERASRGSR